jgi:hypothetical protein
MNQNDENRVIEKIQKLFQLSNSPNENEAAAALKKAEELMKQYNLTVGRVNYIEKRLKLNHFRIPEWVNLVFVSVCYANNCQPASCHGFGSLSLCGRKINVFLSIEMFNYLTETVKRMAKEKCKDRGHKFNHDFKKAVAVTLSERLNEYGKRVSWAVDRDQEIKNIREYTQNPLSKKRAGENMDIEEYEAFEEGQKAGKSISLNKQTGINETGLIGA